MRKGIKRIGMEEDCSNRAMRLPKAREICEGRTRRKREEEEDERRRESRDGFRPFASVEKRKEARKTRGSRVNRRFLRAPLAPCSLHS